MRYLQHFNQLFNSKNLRNKYLVQSNEIDEVLSFIEAKDKEYYDKRKKDVVKNKQLWQLDKEKKIDGLLGEFRAAYFIEKIADYYIMEFEPKGQGMKKLDFAFKDKSELIWYADVKSPSYRNEIVKAVEHMYFKKMCEDGISVSITLEKKDYRKVGTIFCPKCGSKVEHILGQTKEFTDEVLKNGFRCKVCKTKVWNLFNKERTELIKQQMSQFLPNNIGIRTYNGDEAVVDGIRKSIKQFQVGKNNLLIIIHTMSGGIAYGYLAQKDGGVVIRGLLNRHDKQKVITAVMILDFIRNPQTNNFEYIPTVVSAVTSNQISKSYV